MPALGNRLFYFHVDQVPPAAPVYLFTSFGLAPSALQIAPGCRFFLDLQGEFTMMVYGLSPLGPEPADANGRASFWFPMSQNPIVAGLPIATQAVVLDAGHVPPIVFSNATTMVVQ